MHQSLFVMMMMKMQDSTAQVRGERSDLQGEIFVRIAAVAQKPRPQLHTDDAEDEEDEEAEQEYVAQHG